MTEPSLSDAVAFAEAHESPFPRDLLAHLEGSHFDPPPHNAVIGPVFPRGAPNGLIEQGGRRLATWGDPRQADMTFSVAKSYLSLLAGIAHGDGLLPDLDEPVRRRVHDGGFESDQNANITWRHLLTNTSEWEGELFGKSDQIDRGRDLAREGAGPKGIARPLQAPGSYWEYNDVRVNRLSLCLLHLFRRPLPEIFAERIMDPIGGSRDWVWYPYDNAWVEIDGRRLPSVPGGTHWGGGMRIGAEDQALVGRLVLNDGVWGGRRILPEGWVKQSLAPCPLNPSYGFLWWLNGAGRWPGAPADSVFAMGAGGNVTWMWPGADVVAVLRWVNPEKVGAFCAMVARALAR
ncbi:serine hydrolase domain-containing protein [Falsiroseomonas stagni]|uniref:Beta-lactamase n=1 Tax=Falsiroseomonas stagni DSM 19981 TaxID=1123062 RepID=A0A1I4DLV4_9PROT|nr:serine hydrolase [Falsiroseomonas stagni]SFK93700.1 Beta-lactamase [Falsiroseomonas stagni DSM 19981]